MGDEIREGFPKDMAFVYQSEAYKQVNWTRLGVGAFVRIGDGSQAGFHVNNSR